MTEKVEEKIASNGRVVIPKKWRDILALHDNQIIELELYENKIIITKKDHPLTKIIGLFDEIPDFTDEEYNEAKKSLFKNSFDSDNQN